MLAIAYCCDSIYSCVFRMSCRYLMIKIDLLVSYVLMTGDNAWANACLVS
jgi:hypothetical protein